MTRRRKTDDDITLEQDPLWYKDAIFYELHPRAFFDSNGDGVGDFRGLVEKLDYLQDLGVTVLWLLPFYPSPLRDDGYDIANYNDIHPLYGKLADFKVFLREAHRRGLRVVTELVVNHTSDQHPWFQLARHSPPGSPERNFYVWSDTPDRYGEARIIFKDFEPSNWTWDATAKQYYWHRFFYHQPDLNYDNPAVHKAVLDALDFWLSMGVDGLRLDAVPYLYERDGTNCENLPETHAFLKKLRRHVDENFKNRMLLAEANQWPEDAVAYFGAGDECQMCFHFPVMPRLFMGIRMEDRFPILDILQETPAIPENSQWALFLRNHDELTLEMVTDEERDYMYRVYAHDPQARINLGIRRRLAPLLENHRAKIELMNGLLFSLPGTPVLYYGDEIGMGDNIYLGDRNGVRTPMQWAPERNAGFSEANPQRLYLPVVIDPEYHYEAINVEVQQKSPHSLLWWMKRLIGLRRRSKAFSRGSLEFLYPDNHKVLAFVRRFGDERVLVMANLSRFAQSAELDLSAHKGLEPVEMLGRSRFPVIGDQPYVLTLGAYAFYWFSLEPQRVVTLGQSPLQGREPLVEVASSWDEVFRGKGKQILEESLPAYLQGCPWFAGKQRQAEAAMILETIPVPHDGDTAYLTLVQVEYTEGDPETYVLPLAYAEGQSAAELRILRPQAVVCRLRIKQPQPPEEPGFLYDPFDGGPALQSLLHALGNQRRFKRASAELLMLPIPPSSNGTNGWALPDLPVSVLQQSNTLIMLGDQAILKLYRRVEEGGNTELSMLRFLWEKTDFHHLPPLHAALEYRRTWGDAITMAIVEGFVPNEGTTWRYTLDALGHFFERALVHQGSTPELPPAPQPLRMLFEEELPSPAHELIGPYLASAHLLGQRTGEFHLALASSVADPEFRPEPFTDDYRRSLYEAGRTRGRRVFERLRKLLPRLDDDTRMLAGELLNHEPQLVEHLRPILELRTSALRIRCHGDFHLGEVLYTGKDFVIIDLEGEASRPTSNRRRKRSALYDVAGMLRSFHYAAASALRHRVGRPEDQTTLAPWSRLWYLWISGAFIQAYRRATHEAAFLPKDVGELERLLRFYLLKHVIRELHYEMDRPLERLGVPLQGMRYLLESKEGS